MTRGTATRCQEESARPAKRMKVMHHRRDRSSISILGSVSNIGTTIAGFASRLFSPVGPVNEGFDSKPPVPMAIHTPLEHTPWSSSLSLLSIMAEEHVNLWEQLEGAQEYSYIPEPTWLSIQTQSRGYSVQINPRDVQDLRSFLDMEDSDSDSESDGDECLTTEPATGHSAFSDWESDSDTTDSDVLDDQPSPVSSSSSLPLPSTCAASAGHSFWEEDGESGNAYWDRQSATLCAKHIRNAFPDAKLRGELPLERFIVNVLRATRGSVRDDAAFVALQYVKRLAPVCPFDYYEDTFLISLILADKVENDCSHSLQWWTNTCAGRLTIGELRTMEREVLHALDWDVHTSLNCHSSYQSYLAELSSLASI